MKSNNLYLMENWWELKKVELVIIIDAACNTCNYAMHGKSIEKLHVVTLEGKK